VEIRMGDQLLVAGWVFPTPGGPLKAAEVEHDPTLTGYRTLSEGNLEYHEQDCIHDK
jgi:hypothetical protein